MVFQASCLATVCRPVMIFSVVGTPKSARISISSSSSQNSGVSGRCGLPSARDRGKDSRARGRARSASRESQLTALLLTLPMLSCERTFGQLGTLRYTRGRTRMRFRLGFIASAFSGFVRWYRQRTVPDAFAEAAGPAGDERARHRRSMQTRADRPSPPTCTARRSTRGTISASVRQSVAARDRDQARAFSRRLGIRRLPLGERRLPLRRAWAISRPAIDVRQSHDPRRRSRLDLDIAITLNYGSNRACNGGGEPSEAGAWVAHAKSRGYSVAYWTVGNEVYGSWEYDLHAHPHDPHHLCGCGAHRLLSRRQKGRSATRNSASSSILPNDRAWNDVVLRKAQPFDFVELHYYPEYNNDNDSVSRVRRSTRSPRDLSGLRKQMNAAGVREERADLSRRVQQRRR